MFKFKFTFFFETTALIEEFSSSRDAYLGIWIVGSDGCFYRFGFEGVVGNGLTYTLTSSYSLISFSCCLPRSLIKSNAFLSSSLYR